MTADNVVHSTMGALPGEDVVHSSAWPVLALMTVTAFKAAQEHWPPERTIDDLARLVWDTPTRDGAAMQAEMYGLVERPTWGDLLDDPETASVVAGMRACVVNELARRPLVRMDVLR